MANAELIADDEENAQGGMAVVKAGNGSVGGHVKLKAGNGEEERGGDIFIDPGKGETDGGDVNVTLPKGDTGRDGLFIIENMPTADPGVSNALWSDGGVIKISAP